MNDELTKKINDAIADFCIEVIKEPLLYFSEADLQIMLYQKLHSIKTLQKPVETNVRRGFRDGGSDSKYSTSVIHREYGGGGKRRLDIVIWDPKDVNDINDPNLTIDGDYLDAAYAIELGTEKTSEINKHLANDREKIEDNLKDGGIGYIIQFYKDTTRAQTGTDRRTKTEEKIENKFKSVFRDYTNTNPNIKVLAILLRTGRKDENIKGKCEILNKKDFEKCNISKDSELKKYIANILNDNES